MNLSRWRVSVSTQDEQDMDASEKESLEERESSSNMIPQSFQVEYGVPVAAHPSKSALRLENSLRCVRGKVSPLRTRPH